MLTALDTGECVNISAISDVPLRQALVGIMQCLPLQHSQSDGWYKSQEIASVGGVVLMELIRSGHIKQPSALSSAETQASRTAPLHLLGLLAKYSMLAGEIPSLLKTLAAGDAVQLHGIADAEIAQGLARLLRALGAVDDSDDEGLCLPAGRKAADEARRSVLLLHKSLKREVPSPASAAAPAATKTKTTKSYVNSSSSGTGEASVAASHKRPLGPAPPLPPGSTNTSNAPITAGANSGSDSGSDDDMGPAPEGQEAKRRKYKPSQVQVAPSAAAAAMSGRGLGAVFAGAEGDGGEGQTYTNEVGREEWMMTVGDGKAVDALDGSSSSSSFGKERKFAAGKQASQAAKQLQAKKAALAAAARAQPEDPAVAAALQAHQQARGGSLMDMHHDARTALQEAKRSKTKGGKAGQGAPGDFNYQRDMGSFRRKVDSHVKDQMVEDAKQLDTRFDRSLQR